MRHLRLVPDLPMEEVGPYEVAVTNRNPRFANVIYMDIIRTRFEINNEYPFGLLELTHENEEVLIHECIQGDQVTGNDITVESV
jgi:hypothetical protein